MAFLPVKDQALSQAPKTVYTQCTLYAFVHVEGVRVLKCFPINFPPESKDLNSLYYRFNADLSPDRDIFGHQIFLTR